MKKSEKYACYAFEIIKEIVNNCNVEIGYTKDLLPVYDKNIDSKQFLRELSYKGLNKRLNGNVNEKYIKIDLNMN